MLPNMQYFYSFMFYHIWTIAMFCICVYILLSKLLHETTDCWFTSSSISCVYVWIIEEILRSLLRPVLADKYFHMIMIRLEPKAMLAAL